jgi:hypothetical protein
MNRGDGMKIAAALVILVAAGVLIAWNLGVFTSAPEAPPRRAENAPPPAAGPHVAPGVK